MEDVSAGALPDLTAFLPLWVKRLQRFGPSTDEWETEHERWLREAVFRADASTVSSASRERVRVWVCWSRPELRVARDSIDFLLLA